jgi:hypothetical protein
MLKGEKKLNNITKMMPPYSSIHPPWYFNMALNGHKHITCYLLKKETPYILRTQILNQPLGPGSQP